MLFLFKIATESISAQHLQRAEQHKQRQTVNEVAHRGHLYVVLQRVVVFIYQFTAQLVRILGRGLPQERCHIVVVRTFTTALIVDKPRVAIVIEHHVACLEVAIQEGIAFLGCQVLCHQSKVGLQLQLVEINLRSLQETVLKIIQVEQYTVHIKLSLWIAVVEFQVACALNLHFRQFANGAAQQFLLFQGVTSSRFASASNGVEE